MKAAINNYVSEVRGIENQMLVDIRADLGEDWVEAFPPLRELAEFHSSYDAMLREVSEVTGTISRSIS